MRSETRLDSAVFQLTPTRTRCDLVIIANGKTEKIASGLLNPFLNHLKAAQDQISKGGYSITLEPDANNDASWFTKSTVERFVRFVSTPEIVERVTTIESEILQIENAIEIQNAEKVDGHPAKAAQGLEGNKAYTDDDSVKAIVPYKPGSQPNAPNSNSDVSTAPAENSKVQLLRVLESRKIVLQREQAMAFARAAAAGFDMDDMPPLISFSESFGASRLKEACMGFVELWKQKHETGQWIEVEALSESGFSYMNGSGIMLPADSMKQGEAWQASISDIHSENGKGDGKVPIAAQEHIPGQMQHPMYSQWPMYHPSYPMPGMPYYNYPGGVPYFHPPYPPPSDDPRFNTPRRHKKGSKKHSGDTRDSNNESEEHSAGSQDGSDENLSDFEKESSHGRQSHKKSGRSGKKKPGVVVIKNLNYIAKKFGASGSESQSGSDPGSEEEVEEFHSSSRERKNKRSSKTSKKEESKNRSYESSNAYDEKEENSEPRTDPDNWQVFQNFLLKSEEKSRPVDEDMFSGERAPTSKGKRNINEVDPLIPSDRVSDYDYVQRIVKVDLANGAASRMKQGATNDEVLILGEGGSKVGNQFKEIQGEEGAYRKMTSDEFVIYGNQEQLSSNRYSSDPLAGHVYEDSTKVEKDSASYNVTDESFLLPYRSESPDHLEESNRVVVGMDSEYPIAPIAVEDSPKKDNAEYSYEPDDFYLVHDREIDNASDNYDPAFEYDMQTPVENSIVTEAIDQEEPMTKREEEAKKTEKDKKPTGLEKRRKDAPVKRGPPSRLNPLAEAQKRAEKLRSYKADLQKIKKEQEEEKLKRLEALKLERQNRIAARSNSIQSPVAAQSKSRISTKPSPTPLKGSEPRISSPVSKLPVRTSSTGSNDLKAKSSKSNGTLNGLARSASSLSEVTKESNGILTEARASSFRIKRLSEPKTIPAQRTYPLKSASKDQVSKKPADSSRTKITEIMQLDERKSATLPELKIRTSNGEPDTVVNEPPAKETPQKGTEVSETSDNVHRERVNDCKPPSQSNNEDSQIVVKTVVMLENRVVPAPLIQPTEVTINKNEISHDNGLAPEYTGTHASPVVGSSEENRDDQMNSFEVTADFSTEVKKPNTSNEKPYEPSHVRTVTFFEEPASVNQGYADAAASMSEIVSSYSESIRAVPTPLEDLSSVETSDKPRSKEAKGFRKLLKFGRKSTSGASTDGVDSDASSVDDHSISSTSLNDAHLLKNPVSYDNNHPEGAPAKVSRPFSLLSPFRNKNIERKLAA